MTADARRDQQQDVQDRRTSSVVMPSTTRGRDHANSFVNRYRTEIAASSSSVFSTLAAFPLDSVKTRMQTYQYNGFVDCVKHTYRTENLGGFFRGTFQKLAHWGKKKKNRRLCETVPSSTWYMPN